MIGNKELNNMNDLDILNLVDKNVKDDFGKFIKEFNKSEYFVRIAKKYSDHAEYFNSSDHVHIPEYGIGFSVDGKYIPYFHPNRSFHNEVVYLNQNLYYNPEVTFEDRLINSALVKFYGPDQTMAFITGHADRSYLKKTEWTYVNYQELISNEEYEFTLMDNIEKAFASKERIWGTTELRTSLQTESRNYARSVVSPIDKVYSPGENVSDRKMRPSDMILWVKHLTQSKWAEYYKSKPNMEESFEMLTSTRGIGNYYGYHFSSNLARMPGIGAPELIDAEFSDKFKSLQETDSNLSHGNIDENADYVMAGTGACITLSKLFPTVRVDSKSAMRLILAIRNHQEDFYGISGDPEATLHLKGASELGRFTTFGVEISCCQYSVFDRLRAERSMALKRAQAPIAQITGSKSLDKGEKKVSEKKTAGKSPNALLFDGPTNYVSKIESGINIGIDLILENVPVNPGSHKASWLYMWASQLRRENNNVKVLHKENWNSYDKIYIHQGSLLADFAPNVFGGVSDKTVASLKRLTEVDPAKLVSLDVPMLDYGKFIKSRLHNKSTHESAKDVDWDLVSEICKNIPVLEQKTLKTDWLIIGDSHSFSVYEPGAMLCRTDGKTLNGALTARLTPIIQSYGDQIKKLSLYFGNIDIRHHLCRINSGNYKENVDDILNRYEAELTLLKEKYSVEVISALPIENESRIIPNSIGRYKGLAFTGSWSERNECRKYFNSSLKKIAEKLDLDYYDHPSYYENEQYELSFTVMEPKQNVHLSRQHYRWDLDKDEKRSFAPIDLNENWSF